MEHAIPDFHLLSGFLGSGKTSLVVEALGSPSLENTGVIVNEVGQVNIDGATVTSASNGVRMAMLSNGCVCCSIQGDLPFTIASLMDSTEERGGPPLERIILETSGLSRPAPILRSLLGLPVPFRIQVVTTYDCTRNILSDGDFEEAAAQISGAQTIVLTKVDRVSAGAVEQARNTVAIANPFARIIEDAPCSERAQTIFATPPTSLLGVHRTSNHFSSPHPRIQVFLVKPKTPYWTDAMAWLSDMASFCGERLLRVKGIINIDEAQPRRLVQAVGSVFDVPRIVDTATFVEPGVVIIARDLTAAELLAIPRDIEIEVTQ